MQLVDAFGWTLDDVEWVTINTMKSAFVSFPDRLRIINGIDQTPLRVVAGRTGNGSTVSEPKRTNHCHGHASSSTRWSPTRWPGFEIERRPTPCSVRTSSGSARCCWPGRPRRCPTVEGTVETPLTTAPARRLAVQPVVVPVLRAGLGFVHAAQELLPDADVGLRRHQSGRGDVPAQAVRQQAARNPRRPPGDRDRPDAGDRRIVGAHGPAAGRARAPRPRHRRCVHCAAPEGIQRLRGAGLDIHVVTAAIDDHLNDQAFIVPGLGDAGDRQFGCPA